MKQIALALAAPLFLSACMDMAPPNPAPADPAPADPAPADQCGAAGMQSLVGQPASVLAAMTFPAGTRIIEPGMAVTMDYRPDRLNITIGEDGLIAAVACT